MAVDNRARPATGALPRERLYGSPPPATETKSSEVRQKLKRAQELTRERKRSEAVKEMREALTIAQANGDEEEEVEILLALALSAGKRRR
jgi:hypothetical protein